MTGTLSIIGCSGTCSPKGSSDPSCESTTTGPSLTAKTAKIGASFITLCAMCCAVPSVLIALGLIGATTGAYIGTGLKAAMIVLVFLALGIWSMKYLNKNW